MPRSPATTGNSAPVVAVVIPCYRVKAHVLGVITRIPSIVAQIYCVDDGCPEGSGDYIERHCTDRRVRVLRNARNEGVGGAMVTGYRAALAAAAEIVVKVDGDGQMDPALVSRMIAPITDGVADYAKGNRFYRPESLVGMPAVRLIGNAIHSFICKLSSGYWTIFDPANGYTAIHAVALGLLPLEKLSRDYFFEADMLFRLNLIRATVVDIPIDAAYAEEESNLHLRTAILPFIGGHARNALKRYVYNYILRDFNIATVESITGILLLGFGVVFGAVQWAASIRAGQPASAGTVMLSALPVLVSVQMLFSALNFDMANVPRHSLRGLIGREPPVDVEEKPVEPLVRS